MLAAASDTDLLDLGGSTGAERPDTTYSKLRRSGPMRTDLVRAFAAVKDLLVLRLGYSNVDTDGLKTLSTLKHSWANAGS